MCQSPQCHALRIELLAESKCNQLQLIVDADIKTGASAKPLRRRWCKRGIQQLLRLFFGAFYRG
jgi:hypothetical protein